MKKIMIIEDHAFIAKGLIYLLQKNNYETIWYQDPFDASKNIDSIDLILLDVMLPHEDGFTFAKKTKEIKNIPIIFLSAKDQEEDVVTGLKWGDDYMIKPFRNQELLARIENILSRHQKNQKQIYKNIEIDFDALKVKIDDKEVAFSALEFRILELLFHHIGKVMTREKLLEVIWDRNAKFVNDNTLTVAMKRIREKLPENTIKTIPKVGYMIEEEDHEI